MIPIAPPFAPVYQYSDAMAGLHATIGILAALNHRNHTGEGQHVEVSLLATALSGMVNQSTAYVAGGIVPTRMGNAHPSLFPYESLPTADLDLIIAAGNNGQFANLCEILGLPSYPVTQGLQIRRIAHVIVKSYAPYWSRDFARNRPMNGFAC